MATESDIPPFKGGQGRSDEDIVEDASNLERLGILALFLLACWAVWAWVL